MDDPVLLPGNLTCVLGDGESRSDGGDGTLVLTASPVVAPQSSSGCSASRRTGI